MTTPVKYKRRLEIFEAVRFIRINSEGEVPKFDYLPDWIRFAFDNRILQTDGKDLIWGYKGLDRRIKPGNWVLRSNKTGALKVKTDDEFKDQFEQHEQESPH